MSQLRPRKNDRVRHLREVTFREVDDGRDLRGNTIDLSTSGVRLFATRALKVGDRIDLTWSDCVPAVTISGYVVYVKIDAEGACSGVLFHHPIQPKVFKHLCEPTRRRPTV
jgi:hypothetical protein